MITSPKTCELAYLTEKIRIRLTPLVMRRERRHRSHSRAVPMSRVSDGGQSPRKHAQRLRTVQAVTMRWLLPRVVAQEPRNR